MATPLIPDDLYPVIPCPEPTTAPVPKMSAKDWTAEVVFDQWGYDFSEEFSAWRSWQPYRRRR